MHLQNRSLRGSPRLEQAKLAVVLQGIILYIGGALSEVVPREREILECSDTMRSARYLA